jgi:hypothetical protein
MTSSTEQNANNSGHLNPPKSPQSDNHQPSDKKDSSASKRFGAGTDSANKKPAPVKTAPSQHTK